MTERLKSLFLIFSRHCQTKQALCILSALLATSILSPAAADIPHNTLLPGDELDLSVPCVDTHLTVDSQLKNGIVIKASKGTQPDMMQGMDGAQKRLSLIYKTCTQGASLWLAISPNTTLTVHDSPESTITEEGTLAALEANIQDATLSADTIESLDLAANGASQITIHQLDRAAQIAAVATSQIKIDQVNLTALSATMGGKFSAN